MTPKEMRKVIQDIDQEMTEWTHKKAADEIEPLPLELPVDDIETE